MSTHQSQLESANAAAALVASINAIRYFNNYEQMLIDSKNVAVAAAATATNENLFLFPQATQSSSVAATAAAFAAAVSGNVTPTQLASNNNFQFHHINQQFHNLTQQFQHQISQMRFDSANNANNMVNQSQSPTSSTSSNKRKASTLTQRSPTISPPTTTTNVPSSSPSPTTTITTSAAAITTATATTTTTTNTTSASSPTGHKTMINVTVLDESELPKDDSKCHVCGDKSTGSHFGGISCESCKAFFRRSVQRNRWEEYKCSYSGECKMNTNTRKICQYCRYKKCLSIGMRPKWVLSDEERQQKYGSRRKKNKIADLTQTMNQSTNCEAMEVNDTENETNEILEEKFYKYGVEAINIFNKNLTSYDQILINKLSYAFYYSRQAHELDLNVIETKLQQLSKLNVNSPSHNDELSKLSKLILANFMVQPVKRVITFAKLIPDFRKLMIEDQMALLRGSTMEIFICSSQNLFDKTTNSFHNLISKERNIQSTTNPCSSASVASTQSDLTSSNSIQLDILRFIWSDDVLERTISYLKSMNDLNIDETTLVLYIPLILFSPDRRELTNRERILQIQNKYSTLLYKYLFYKYDKQVDIVNNLYTKLLLKMINLRDLHELHSSILLDVADSSELELYSQAIIKDNKDENDKIKNCSQIVNSRTDIKCENFSDVASSPSSSIDAKAYANSQDDDNTV